MLKNIPRQMPPELMKAMLEMGHGDELLLCDGNYPKFGCPERCVRMDGHGISEILDMILAFFPLDAYVEHPVTLMAVLNTARAVIRDSETRRMAHVIKDELGKLAKDFSRFDERMKKLASHIEQANKDVSEVRISSDKISRRFQQIERVELEHPDAANARLLDDDE